MLYGSEIFRNEDYRKKALRPVLLLLPLFPSEVILICLKRNTLKSHPASLACPRQEKVGQKEKERLPPFLTKGDEEGLDRLSKVMRRLNFFEFFQAEASNP